MAPALLQDPQPGDVLFPSKPTVYVLDRFHPEVEKYCKENFNAIFPGSTGHGEWRSKAKFLLVKGSVLTAADIASCPNLLAIGKQGVGTDKIDIAACEARGIKILNTPGVNARAVAEVVLTLATSVARSVGHITSRQQSGQLVPKETCRGLVLYQRTLGLIGLGNIGKTVAQIFQGAFDASIIAYDPYLPAEAWHDLPYKRATSIKEVLREADVISLHVPLTESTRNLIAYPQFRLMKKEAILINAARGGIVNEADLEIAVREGLIWGAGLDCHTEEPPSKEKYGNLWDLGVVSTPHIGAATEQTQIETGTAAARKLLEYARTCRSQ